MAFKVLLCLAFTLVVSGINAQYVPYGQPSRVHQPPGPVTIDLGLGRGYLNSDERDLRGYTPHMGPVKYEPCSHVHYTFQHHHIPCVHRNTWNGVSIRIPDNSGEGFEYLNIRHHLFVDQGMTAQPHVNEPNPAVPAVHQPASPMVPSNVPLLR